MWEAQLGPGCDSFGSFICVSPRLGGPTWKEAETAVANGRLQYESGWWDTGRRDPDLKYASHHVGSATCGYSASTRALSRMGMEKLSQGKIQTDKI